MKTHYLMRIARLYEHQSITKSVATDIEQFINMIKEGRLKWEIGCPERTLVEMFNVSRASVREASVRWR